MPQSTPPDCPACGLRNTGGDVGNKLFRCVSCDHVFQYPPDITANYNQEYVADRYDKYGTTALMSHLRLGFLQAISPAPKRILDVGYGNGDFIKLAVKAGYDAFGNDVHGCGEKYGVRDVPLDDNSSWDAVMFYDSLEHFPDVAAVRALCHRAKVVIVSMPHRPNDFPDNTNWKHYRPGEHLHYFSWSSLNDFMRPKRCVIRTNAEDIIRGMRGNEWNIFTSVYKEVPTRVASHHL